jgi:hypothetical protein
MRRAHPPESISPLAIDQAIPNPRDAPTLRFRATTGSGGAARTSLATFAVIGLLLFVAALSTTAWITDRFVPRPAPHGRAVAPPAPERARPPSAQVATTGTLVVPASATVVVDGEPVSGPRATLRCGTHAVNTGPRRRPVLVDVPCGGEITVR